MNKSVSLSLVQGPSTCMQNLYKSIFISTLNFLILMKVANLKRMERPYDKVIEVSDLTQKPSNNQQK
jgi:hypothetical protein